MRFRIEQGVFACSLALVGLSIGVLRALRNPNSRVSLAVDTPVRVQLQDRHLRAVARSEAAAVATETARTVRRIW